MNELVTKEFGGEFLLYQTEDGQVKIEVSFQNETVWLTQQMIAELSQTMAPNISMHIRNIYAEGELTSEATIKKFLKVRQEGNRDAGFADDSIKTNAVQILCQAGIDDVKSL